MCVLTSFVVKKMQTWTKLKSGKDEPKLNHESWTAGNRGSPTFNVFLILWAN